MHAPGGQKQINFLLKGSHESVSGFFGNECRQFEHCAAMEEQSATPRPPCLLLRKKYRNFKHLESVPLCCFFPAA
jgi:hypothetical protein